MLPRGMANSPTMCQLFVAEAIAPLREEFPKIRCINYMDDILLAAKDEEMLNKSYLELVKLLEICNLVIASEKVQRNTVINYLGAKIFPHTVIPQKIEIRKDNLRTLNDFQKLLGDINWIRCYLKLPNYELKPLYNILNGDSALDSPRQLTTEAREALKKIETELQNASLKRQRENMDILLCVLPTFSQPTALLW